MRPEVSKLRATVARDYEISRKEFFKWNNLLYEKSFEMIDRGDAYKDSSIDENGNLILVFNDIFLKLFILLAKELEPVYLKALEEQMTISKI